MNREEKIEIIIVNLFRKILSVNDNNILIKIFNNLKEKNLDEKEIILRELLKKENFLNNFENNINLFFKKAKNNLLELSEKEQNEKNFINLLK